MGIKFLYSLLKRKYPHMYCTTWGDDPKQQGVHSTRDVCLGIDLNNMIHICAQEAYRYGMYAGRIPCNTPLPDILKRRIESLLTLYRPKYVYIATDGVPSSAKMFQQRQRRFSRQTCGPFDTNLISPGTSFMRTIEDTLRKCIPRWKHRYRISNIEYSTDLEHGEGEMKIFQYLVSGHVSLDNLTCIIYGQDADIMLLSLILYHKHLHKPTPIHQCVQPWVHRPNTNDPDGWEVVDICEFYKLLEFTSDKHFGDVIRTLCLIGNDFVPSMASMNLLKDLNSNENLFDDLLNLVRKLSLRTKTYRTFMIEFFNLWQDIQDAYLVRFWDMTNTPDMRKDYYTRKLGKSYDMYQICDGYYNMMKWVYDYYTNFQVPDWDYVYPHVYAPFVDEFRVYLAQTISNDTSEPIWNTDNQPISYIEQWTRIMPPTTLRKLCGDEYTTRVVDGLSKYFPSNVEIDMEHKEIEWEGVVRVPYLPRSSTLNELVSVWKSSLSPK